MLISEVAGAEAQAPRLMALAKFFADQARDQAVEPRIDRATFIKMAGRLGISITPRQLKDMIQQEPLNGAIQDVTGDDDASTGPGEVIFRGAEPEPGSDLGEPGMMPDQAQATVDAMSKRAALKDL